MKDGPYLSLAAICEKVLTEQDGVLSLIRIIDRVVVATAGSDVPDELPPTPLNFTVVVALKSGSARGRHKITLRPENPSGQQMNSLEVPIHFEGEDRGANVIIGFNMTAEQEGLYWIDVLFGETVLTRMPLRVIYQPRKTS